MPIDTLGYVKALKAAGVPGPQAEAHAEAMRDHIVPTLTTKQDLKEAVAELRTEIRATKAEMHTDMWRMALGIVVATASLVTFLQKFVH